ncbi:MAG: polysaccharide biosynthesis protein [Clostridia bacterium]|nr:polysaccharide biosynthesis protein [Clostridia bacterium]
MAYDIMAINISYFVALWIRFDGVFSEIPEKYLDPYVDFIPFYTVISLVVFYFLRMYHSVWEYVSVRELMKAAIGSLSVSAVHIVLITVLFQRMPISYYLWGTCFQMLMLLGVRFSYRIFSAVPQLFGTDTGTHTCNKIMIIGAGDAGRMLLENIQKTRANKDRVVCMIDDNPDKQNRYFNGVQIVGGRDDILNSVKKYNIDKIYIAIPSASKESIRDIVNICKETGCETKTLPDFYQYVNSGITAGALKDVSVEDLLGRDPINADMKEVYDLIEGKTILVTGGGGSIGSELCRQVAAHTPARLIVFDIYENNAYAIQQELRDKYPELKLDVLIGSVRDSRRLDNIFKIYHPDIVYHAAAHKHVPLMEDSPCEAIKNNVIGTYKTAYAAMVNNCSRFVLISTDKAVNPTNIMGASKRLCEMVIQAFDREIKESKQKNIPKMFTHLEEDGDFCSDAVPENVKTEFVAVRFGNVLGSNGSVVPLFKRQIQKGGPVTVTHPEIIRYFMTIPEAVSLVLLAGAYAHGGEIFVLDMGSPVKIDTLARNLIKLSGLKPDIDIRVEYTGLRPGEKLYEEKLMEEEGLQTTPNKLIHIGNPIQFDIDLFHRQLEELMLSAYENRCDINEKVREMVPTYKSGN